MHPIRAHFQRMVPLSDHDWTVFASKLTHRVLPKNALLLKRNSIENHLSFVEQGVIRYVLLQEETDLTFAFVFEGEFVTAYDSFLTRMPSAYHLQTLTPTVLWQLHYNDLQDIYRETTIGNTIGRLAAEALFIKKAKRELSLLNNSPTERYLKLFEERPDLLQRIPLKYIAAYIGITPQALSRIRKRIS